MAIVFDESQNARQSLIFIICTKLQSCQDYVIYVNSYAQLKFGECSDWHEVGDNMKF